MTILAEDGSKTMRVLLVANKLHASPSGGRAMLCKLNHNVLLDLYGHRLAVFELHTKPVQGLSASINAFRGYIDGLTVETCELIIKNILSREIDKVFVDGSNLGQLARVLARALPNVEIIVFFHNVEARFFWGAFKGSKNLHSFFVLVANYLAERKSVRYAHKIVCLSIRDSQLLSFLYGRAATHVTSIALQDRLPSPGEVSRDRTEEDFILFVGGSFYANCDGITWFVDNVVPRISIKTVVVGKGLEAMKDRLERTGNVVVVGAVDSLAPWYRDALAVIAPIFDGSGMKTKVAEALMHGKKVIGTPEAFSGYEEVIGKVGWVCSTPQEFADAIAAAQSTRPAFLPELRSLYEQYYSFDAARLRIAEILDVSSH
jgi:glycosyltransferase involved in cell wall biosynthesis